MKINTKQFISVKTNNAYGKNSIDLDQQINEFFKDKDVDIIDVKYNTFTKGDAIYSIYYTALFTYKVN